MTLSCAAPHCERPIKCRGWCQLHYDRWIRHGNPLTVKKRGIKAQPCKSPGCKKRRMYQGWCQGHWRRIQRHGDPMSNVPLGSIKTSRYVGKVHKCERFDIVYHPNHPLSNKSGYVLFHRLEAYNKEKITKQDRVYKDGVPIPLSKRIVKCEMCGRTVVRTLSQIRNHVFCSRECYGKARSKGNG